MLLHQIIRYDQYLPSKSFLVDMEIDVREDIDAYKILFPLLKDSLMLPIKA